MKHILICNLLIGSFLTITAMDDSHKKSLIWVQTQDKQIITIDNPIARQSNLLTVLREKYSGSQCHPIPMPITKKELDFFCNSVTQPAETLATNLTDKHYSELMNITEKLKAKLFYTELMQQLLQIKELCNHFTPICLNQAPLKKAIYKKCLKKKCITTHKNGTDIVSIKFSNDGRYFTETVTNGHEKWTTYLWNTEKFSLIKPFIGHRNLIFSPNNDYIILSPEKDIDRFLYFIREDVFTGFSNPQNTQRYPKISPDGHYIVHNHQLYSIQDSTIIPDKTINKDFQANIFLFHPRFPLIISNQSDKSLNTITIQNLENSDKLCTQTYPSKNIYPHKLNISTDGSLLLLNGSILLNIKNPDSPIIIKELDFCDLSFNFYEYFINQKNILLFTSSSKYVFFLIDEYGNVITSDDAYPNQQAASNTGNHLALFFNKSKKIKLYNLSLLPKILTHITIKINAYVNGMTFTKDQLLLTRSYRTKLWDMDGDEVLDLGPMQHNDINPQTGSIITSQNLTAHLPSGSGSSSPIPGPTELYHWDINAPKAKALIKKVTESLTPSQALLLNAHSLQQKTKKLYPNLPEGRAFASLAEKNKFLAKKFKLNKSEYIPAQIKDI